MRTLLQKQQKPVCSREMKTFWMRYLYKCFNYTLLLQFIVLLQTHTLHTFSYTVNVPFSNTDNAVLMIYSNTTHTLLVHSLYTHHTLLKHYFSGIVYILFIYKSYFNQTLLAHSSYTAYTFLTILLKYILRIHYITSVMSRRYFHETILLITL